MELSQQVTSLELSKKLQALGVKQKSYFFWTKRTSRQDILLKDYGVCQGKQPENEDEFSAFTVAELGEMLPRGLCSQKAPDTYHMQYDSNVWRDSWHMKGLLMNERELWEITRSDTEADARALLLIYLLEHNLITL